MLWSFHPIYILRVISVCSLLGLTGLPGGLHAADLGPLPKVTQSNQSEDYVLDPEHCSIAFSVPHLVISEVKGRFQKVSGDFTLNDMDLKAGKSSALKVKATIDTASITTDNPKRDAHLMSADFFDAKKYPAIVFESTSIDVKDGAMFLNGDLTIKDVKKSVSLALEYKGTVIANDKKRAAFKASTKFNRRDFNLKWSDAVESGPVAGYDVTVDLVIQGVRKVDLN
ncbi:MAG: YceI family protein [Proteobacteria bacterium]|nr:MAG: YceI family protein [Pseudomonadota bacterium]